MGLNIIGISALYHDSACCILKEGNLVAAAQEERFTRIKADPNMPVEAFKYCLREAGLTLTDIDGIAYYESPEKKLARQIWSKGNQIDKDYLKVLNPKRAENEIRLLLGYDGPIKYYEHHQSHAASSFYYSGFKKAALLTVDGVGEWATTTYGQGSLNKIDLFEEVHFPNSLGLLYSTITSYLGFGVNDGEYKVMGLAPYGAPKYADKICQLLEMKEQGQYELNLKYFQFVNGDKMYSEALTELFGFPARIRGTEMLQFHKDMAKSLQVVLERVLLNKVNYLHRRTGESNLCMAGGVALNCVANGKILREGPFEKLFVQPASGDAGCAIGAAAMAHIEMGAPWPQHKKMEHVYLGPEYSMTEIEKTLKATSLKYLKCHDDEHELLANVAKRLSEGKVIGWFHGRMEFGPRALGARSILADPRDPNMRDRINAMVKKREGFRPFAPVILEEEMQEHFDMQSPSPFMLETCQVVSRFDLPAITHVDGSARVQTVDGRSNKKFQQLLLEFQKLTTCPILLNTSFNVKGEPIVCSPEDAIKCFITTDIDCLVLENFIVDRTANTFETLELILSGYNEEVESRNGIRRDVYTFV